MRKNFLPTLLGTLALSPIVLPAQAAEYYSSGPGYLAAGYESRGSQPAYTANDMREPHWVNMGDNLRSLPRNAVIGGNERGRLFYVCHGRYANGLHPGKLLSGYCNIGWGGNEIRLSRYQVLVSAVPLSWVSASYGAIPRNAIRGGFEPNRPLFICQAEYRGGMHPGKLIDQACNISWGGKEIRIPYYNVLVR